MIRIGFGLLCVASATLMLELTFDLVFDRERDAHRSHEIGEGVTGRLHLGSEDEPGLLHEAGDHGAFGRIEQRDVVLLLAQKGASHQRSFSKVAQRP